MPWCGEYVYQSTCFAALHGEPAVILYPDEAKAAVSQPEYTEFSDLKGKTVSMITGAPFEELVLSKEPDVGQFTYFSSIPDIILALKRIRRDPGHLVRGG